MVVSVTKISILSLFAPGSSTSPRRSLYRARNRAEQMAPIDAGMPASFESWLDAGARLARVRYRGASWDARVEGGDALEPGATVYVLAADGNTLRVTKTRP